MSDTLLYDMSNKGVGTPNVFLKKETLSILSNQNGSYSGNSCVIDSSQLANSNKYMDWKNGRLIVPLLLTLTSSTANKFDPNHADGSADHVLGLRNWYGSIFNSCAVDYNGASVVSQQNLIPMWNTFKLMTTLSLGDIKTQGSTIGFYPDNARSVSFFPAVSVNGIGTCNNSNLIAFPVVNEATPMESGNDGFYKRQSYWNYDADGLTSTTAAASAFSTMLTSVNAVSLYKSHVFNKFTCTAATGGVFQAQITSVVYLKHLHSFFGSLPLLKGAFFRIVLGLSQPSITFATDANKKITVASINNPLGGVSPLQIASADGANGSSTLPASCDFIASLCVGGKVINSTQSSQTSVQDGSIMKDILLEVDAMTFNPVFEEAYLSENVKTCEYEDIYQYKVSNVGAGEVFSNLLTNGLSGIQTVLTLPFFTTTANAGLNPIESPFCGEGSGTTSPLVHLSNFNVSIAGSKQLYSNTQYLYQSFLNNLKGFGSVNGDMTDGLTSGLISQQDFETSYGYYVVNCGRQLPVEEMIPKSVHIEGRNMSAKAIDLICFISYKQTVKIDVLTGGRI